MLILSQQVCMYVFMCIVQETTVSSPQPPWPAQPLLVVSHPWDRAGPQSLILTLISCALKKTGISSASEMTKFAKLTWHHMKVKIKMDDQRYRGNPFCM